MYCHDISFEAKPGETTAIIGSTGSGKSTLVNLIPRFYDVTEGKITLDGLDIREVAQHDLREKLGYVPQKGVLFSGTIASNIMFGNPDGSDEEMKEAAQIAQATEFIETKRKRYDSSIAQGGSNVSGGQKQRLSIARAIAKHPKLFIFDDSFSALDFKTDVALRRALRERKRQTAPFSIVAQRISTILHAEQILVLDDGQIVGKGTHEELLRNCEVYQQIAAITAFGRRTESRDAERRRMKMSEKQGRHTGHRHMGHGPMHGMGAGEKAKDFKGTLKKLLHYLSMFKVQMFFVFLFAVGGTVFNIVGPKILGKATTEIFNGLVSKVSGGAGMDFEKIGEILLFTLGLYVISAAFSFIQGYLMSGISQKTTYQSPKRDIGKNQSDADELL